MIKLIFNNCLIYFKVTRKISVKFYSQINFFIKF